MVEDGALVSRADLLATPPADEDHRVPRRVIEEEEAEISSRPRNTRILAVHYRARLKLGMSDDRIVIAIPEGKEYRVLKVLDSDAAEVNGQLSSLNDFELQFISIREFRFLYVQDRQGKTIDDLVYTLAGPGRLITIPFAQSKPRLLSSGEELRNSHCELDSQGFQCTAGVYLPKDAQCCPSRGSYRTDFRLKGDFQYEPARHHFKPDFEFAPDKEWRTNE